MTTAPETIESETPGAGATTAMSPSAAASAIGNEVRLLRVAIERLRQVVRDHETALLKSNQHVDVLEERLYRVNKNMAAEIRERQAVEEKLGRIVEAISKEKCDLEVLVQILIDQGDDAAEEGAQARIDGLTGIANRRRLDEFLLSEWNRRLRTQEPVSVLVCDVDHFKLYNDFYGHQAGDECLKAVAEALSRCTRAGDLAARYGGEEFALILPGTDLATAVGVAERVRATVATAALPHEASPVCGHVTLSIGIACKIPELAGTGGMFSLIREADKELYLAKRRGRNQAAYSDGTDIESL
jgi:diguanylate cyclase (GGDEF)-like protein